MRRFISAIKSIISKKMGLFVNFFSASVVSALFSWILLPKILQICKIKGLFDSHDERKIHSGVVPRLGGVAFFPALLFTFLVILSINLLLKTSLVSSINITLYIELMLALSAILLIYFTGVGDDLVNIRYRTKLMIQIVAGILFTSSGVWINNLYGLFGLNEIDAAIGIPLTVIVIVFIINSINFIDGIDGLAAGIGMFAFLCYGFIFLYMQLYVYSLLAFSSFGVLIPFFYYNVFGKENKGTKIFMGDSGSLTIGVLLSVFAVKVCHYNPDSLYQLPQSMVFAFSVLLVPMFDALRVALFRVYTGKSPFKPDKNHIHHQFLQLGFSHKAIMLMILTIVVFLGTGSILLAPYVDINLLLGLIIVLWAGMDIYLRMKIKHVAQPVPAKSRRIIKQVQLPNKPINNFIK